MTYTIQIELAGDWLWNVTVSVMDDEGAEVLAGGTLVGCETEEEARQYAEEVFLPDLKRNYDRQIGELVLPSDVPPEEVIPDEY